MTSALRKGLSLLFLLLLLLCFVPSVHAEQALPAPASPDVIVGFEALDGAERFEVDHKLALVTLKERFPAALSVRLAGSDAPLRIPVDWKCVEGYDKPLDTFHFEPITEGYALAEGVQAPVLTVFVRGEFQAPPLNYHANRSGADIPIIGVPNGRKRSGAELSYFNSWEEGRLPPIRDQGQYGTCWAFATLGAMEADLVSDGADREVDLSELHLAYYSYHSYYDEKDCNIGDFIESPERTFLDQGGSLDLAIHTLENIGCAPEAAAPYAWAGDYTPGIYEGRAYRDVHLAGSCSFNPADIDAIKDAIYTHGSVATEMFMDDKFYSAEYNSYYCPDEFAENHAIMLVGWDDDFSKDHFISGTPEGDGAWLVRNSWGAEMYDSSGYFWMSYYDQPFLNRGYVVAFDAAPGQYDHCYAYDAIPSQNTWQEKGEAAAVQRFRVDGGEEICAVGIDIAGVNMGITASLTLGDKTVSASTAASFPGYKLLTFSEPLPVPRASDVELTINYTGESIKFTMETVGPNPLGEALFTGFCGGGGLVVNGKNTGRDAWVKLFTNDSDSSGEGVRVSSDSFPDNAFRSYVSLFDKDRDGFLSYAELDAVTAIDISPASATVPRSPEASESGTGSVLAVEVTEAFESPGPVASLKGIEHFTELQRLSCRGNRLTELDISRNTKLQYLDCGGNSLASLDVASCPELQYLDCSGNVLASLDVASCPKLKYLDCSGNALASLDVASCRRLMQLIAYTRPALVNDSVRFSSDSAALVYKASTHLSGFSLESGIPISEDLFPDPFFRAYVADNCDMDHDGTLCDYELASVKWIDCSGLSAVRSQIASLEGIGLFPALEELYCDFSSVTALDLRGITSLRIVSCRECRLEKLDARNLTALEKLDCFKNTSLTELDVRGCSALSFLGVSYSALDSLDLSGCAALEELYCHDVKSLTTLDVSGCSGLHALECYGCELSALELGLHPELRVLYCYRNPLTALDISQCRLLLLAVENGDRQEGSYYVYYPASFTYDGETYSIGLTYGKSCALTLGDDLLLPDSLTSIGEEAFAGGAFTRVMLSAQTTSIGRRAFADCGRLILVRIPAETVVIDPEAFGDGELLTICGVPGSGAEAYALEHGCLFFPLK